MDILIKSWAKPVLIVSSMVGRGNCSIGEAVQEKFLNYTDVYHIAIEDYMPKSVVDEDLKRYKVISNRFPFLLGLIYRIPVFYYRKLLRELVFKKPSLHKLKQKIDSLNIKTVICISHRPTFWLSVLKRREKMNFEIWGILNEFGRNLGWKYLFWKEVNGFIAPLSKDNFDFDFPINLEFVKANVPVRKDFKKIAQIKGNKNKLLLIGGFFGQGPIYKTLKKIVQLIPQLEISVICGDNVDLYQKIYANFSRNSNISIYGIVSSLLPFLKESAAVITKPGMSTILEAHAANRKIFLLKGVPVAEDHNANYANKNFGAEWFSLENFRIWYLNS